MTTKLIQELLSVCAEKGVYVTHNKFSGEIRFISAMDDIKCRDRNFYAKIQAAIDKIKEL